MFRCPKKPSGSSYHPDEAAYLDMMMLPKPHGCHTRMQCMHAEERVPTVPALALILLGSVFCLVICLCSLNTPLAQERTQTVDGPSPAPAARAEEEEVVGMQSGLEMLATAQAHADARTAHGCEKRFHLFGQSSPHQRLLLLLPGQRRRWACSRGWRR